MFTVTAPRVHHVDPRIVPEDLDVIQTNQDLYLCDQDFDTGGTNNGGLMRLSHTLLTNYWGDLVVIQGGECNLLAFSSCTGTARNSLRGEFVIIIRLIISPVTLNMRLFAPMAFLLTQ